jgi:GTPase Era involved in 16S rRNA processing
VLFNRFYYDIPFKVRIDITEIALRSDNKMKLTVDLDVEDKIQIKMLVGYKGRNIKNLI